MARTITFYRRRVISRDVEAGPSQTYPGSYLYAGLVNFLFLLQRNQHATYHTAQMQVVAQPDDEADMMWKDA